MALNINLYVHGVPMGHKSWGVQGADNRYINTFYGPKWQAKELMLVEIMNMEGKAYSYYTFIKDQNVLAYDNRPGSYFALTLRMDAYYADLQNVYNILSAAYNKMCVGKLIQVQGDNIKFLVQTFNNLDTELKHIEERIISYIGEFSNNGDLLPLNGFKFNGQQAAGCENLLECDNAKAISVIKSTGKISVSPFFPAKELQKYISKKDDEMKQLQQTAAQQIDDARNHASQQVIDIRRQTNEEIENVRRQAANDMAHLKSQYANVDTQIEKLKRECRQEHNAATQSQDEVKKLSATLRQREQEIHKLHSNGGGNEYHLQRFYDNKNSILSMVFPFLNLLVIVVVASYMIWKMPGDNSMELEQINTELADLKTQLTNTENKTHEPQNHEETLVQLADARINIVGGDHLALGAPTKVSVLKEGKIVKNGTWSASDKNASVEQNDDGTATITATKTGKINITYMFGNEYTKREVDVK